MVSALWNVCAAEAQDLEGVQRQLKEPGVDLEIKDHAGTTPLIQAVRNGHKDIIKLLIAAGLYFLHRFSPSIILTCCFNRPQICRCHPDAHTGADINNASSQGKPETYTTDPEILALLQAKSALAQPTYEGYPHSSDPNTPYDPAMQQYYYPAPPGHEAHYPPYPYPMMPPAEGQPPMPPFPSNGDANSPGHLPPADVARTIPCRYFPVCRYGSSCMFLHPQPTYFSGPPPPAPHYPQMYPPPHPYYMMRPGAYPHPPPPGAAPVDPSASPVTGTQPFPPPVPISYPPPPNGAPPFSPATNGAPFPPVNGAPFPNGAPYPPSTNGAPYPPPTANGAPFSPASSGTPYTPATNGTPSPFGPPPFSPGSATPYSANSPYTPGPVPVPYGYPRPYTEAPKEAPVNGVVNGTSEETQAAPSAGGLNGTGNHPNGFVRRNGRGGRRESFGTGRQPKPPCLFFPSGRCRNGDDCRFPHVMPEPGVQATFRYPNNNNTNNGRFNGHRSRQSMSHQDGPTPVHIPPGTKLPFAPGGQLPNSAQRVPSADDFPVLKGGAALERATPAASAGGNGNGLTAAQVLQAPAPAKKGKTDSEVGDLADAFSKASLTGFFRVRRIDKNTQVHVNGLPASTFEPPSSTPEITAVGA
ncbi:unnamed protein product [Rhizoctonia solani]|uniref:C3H1-type domain-containing protein n=1 Tax=Rhizoctonia solani TaxID=456999 RepID=A0A8H3HSH6_9AGAM|nr:unnamed protein product [Rhizoctonia solani]